MRGWRCEPAAGAEPERQGSVFIAPWMSGELATLAALPREGAAATRQSFILWAARQAGPGLSGARRRPRPSMKLCLGTGDFKVEGRSEERRVGKECRSRWS